MSLIGRANHLLWPAFTATAVAATCVVAGTIGYNLDSLDGRSERERAGYETGKPRVGRQCGGAGSAALLLVCSGSSATSLTPRGALLVGSPQQVIDKILFEHELFKHDRFMAQMALGAMPHDRIMKAIELFGTEVAPAVRKALKGSELGE